MSPRHSRSQRLRIGGIALIILTLIASPALPARAATNVPFVFAQGMIWLKVSAQGSSQPMFFLLDSGASRTALSTQAAARLGLTPGRPEMMTAIQGPCSAFQIQPTPVFAQNVPLGSATVEIDLAPLTAPLGHAVDGLIGADFFYHRSVEIDYQAQVLRVDQPGSQSGFPGDAAVLSVREGAICVKASVNGGLPAWFRVDTGCGSALEWCASQSSAGSVASSAPANSAFRSMTKVGVNIGPRRFDRIEAGLHSQPMFPGESGLLGNGLLSRCMVTIDVPDKRLSMSEPN